MKILTLNCWSEGEAYQTREPLLIQNLASLDVDVAALEEIFPIQKAKRIAKAAGYPVLARAPQHSGLNLLTHFRKRDSGYIHLKTKSPREDYFRYVLWVRLEVDKKPWDFFVTHLSWRSVDSEIRERQIAEVEEWVEKKNQGRYPCVLAGDMNATPDTPEMKFLRGTGWLYLSQEGIAQASRVQKPWQDTFFEANRHGLKQKRDGFPKENRPFVEPVSWCTWSYKNHYTLRENLPERRIDYIWFRPETGKTARYKIRSSRICCNQSFAGVYPTDHFGVVTELAWF